MAVTPQIPGILRASSGVGAFWRLFVLPPCFFTLCLNVKRGLTGRGSPPSCGVVISLGKRQGHTDGRHRHFMFDGLLLFVMTKPRQGFTFHSGSPAANRTNTPTPPLDVNTHQQRRNRC